MQTTTLTLELRNLSTEFRIGGKWHAAIRNVSLSVHKNETLAIVGESGSGKSVTALSILRVIPRVDSNTATLEPIPGSVPAITAMPAGCTFAARCPLREPICETQHPPLTELPGSKQQVRCFVRARQAEGHT